MSRYEKYNYFTENIFLIFQAIARIFSKERVYKILTIKFPPMKDVVIIKHQ